VNVVIEKDKLRATADRESTCVRLETTIAQRADSLLRSIVQVRRGGQGGAFISLAITLLYAILRPGVDQENLEYIGLKLVFLAGYDQAHIIQHNLMDLARQVDTCSYYAYDRD
jgi:hypothetical protein